jgi:hypothetical protein
MHATVPAIVSPIVLAIAANMKSIILTGRGLVPAECEYADVVQAGDVLNVDFDTVTVSKSGLYLLDAINSDGAAKTMCRRFDRRLDGVSVDETGRGDWRDLLPDAGLKVVGYVEQVFRAC